MFSFNPLFSGTDVFFPKVDQDKYPHLYYNHFAVVMNPERRLALFTVHMIDGTDLRKVKRAKRWKFDKRIPKKWQAGNDVYKRNPWDRGHLVRRSAVAWGEDAKRASDDTFHYTNAAPQHENFNQDEWLKLENWILARGSKHGRATVFTGPVFREDDPVYRGIQIPSAYWKVVVTLGKDRSPIVCAFLMKQNEMWDDKRGAKYINLETYQVDVSEIQSLTGIPFKFVDDYWEPQQISFKTISSPHVIKGPEDIKI